MFFHQERIFALPRYSRNDAKQSKWSFILSALLLTVCLITSCLPSRTAMKQKVPVPAVQLSDDAQLEYERQFMDATKLKLLGNFPDAANMLTQCADIKPYDAAVNYQLAEIYYAVNDLPNAMRYSQRAVKQQPDNHWYKLQLANVCLAQNKLDSAITVYAQIVETQPYNPELRYNMALLYLENNMFKKAIKQLDRIEKTYGFTEEIALAKYKAYSQKRDRKATENILKRGIKQYPDELRFYGLLAELYSSLGKQREASEYYNKLLEEDPENAFGYISMIEFYKDYGRDDKALEETQRMYGTKNIDPELKIELYLKLSSDTVFCKKYNSQMDTLIRQLYEKHPDNLRVRLINVDLNMREKNFVQAKNDLLYITTYIQTNYFLWEHLFHLLYILEENEMLLETTGKALQYFADSYIFNFFHGYAASMLNQQDRAISSFLVTLKKKKKEKKQDMDIELQTYILLAEAYNVQKLYAESDDVFERAIAISPYNPIILNNYSYYLALREEKLDIAEQYIKRCITFEPNNSTFLDTYAWVLYKLGQIDEAIIIIKKAIKNGGGNNTEIIEHYCELITTAGRSDEYNFCED
jgi:tetratricopeptide (TPR) repeat protein